MSHARMSFSLCRCLEVSLLYLLQNQCRIVEPRRTIYHCRIREESSTARRSAKNPGSNLLATLFFLQIPLSYRLRHFSF